MCACVGIPSLPTPAPQGSHQESDLVVDKHWRQSGGVKAIRSQAGEKSYFPEQRQTPGPPPLPQPAQALRANTAGLPGSGCPVAKGWKPFHARAQQPAEPSTEQNSLWGSRRLGRRGHQPAPPLLVHPRPRPRIPAPLQFDFQRWGHHDMESCPEVGSQRWGGELRLADGGGEARTCVWTRGVHLATSGFLHTLRQWLPPSLRPFPSGMIRATQD